MRILPFYDHEDASIVIVRILHFSKRWLATDPDSARKDEQATSLHHLPAKQTINHSPLLARQEDGGLLARSPQARAVD